MQENEQVEKEIIEGYEIQFSMKVGGKRFAFGIHMDPSHKDRYFEGIITTNEIFVNYEGYASDDYFEIMHRLIDNMAKELESMEQKRAAIGMEDVSCLKREDLIPISGDESIVGKVVAIDEKYLHDGYKDISHQLYLTDSGFGAEGGGRGKKNVRLDEPDDREEIDCHIRRTCRIIAERRVLLRDERTDAAHFRREFLDKPEIEGKIVHGLIR